MWRSIAAFLILAGGALSGCGARSELPTPGGPVQAISLGNGSSWALLDDGSLWTWGDGLPMAGAVAPEPVPARTDAPAGIMDLSAGYGFVCPVLRGGSLWCWGANNYGESGVPPVFQGSVAIATPAAIASGVSSVTAGEMAACAVRADGAALCWGVGVEGELGNAAQTGFGEPVPTVVEGIEGVQAIATKLYRTCAVIAGGGVRCWGRGLLGDGGPSQTTPVPTPVAGLTAPATGIAVGIDHACALMEDGTVACWGNGAHGELGLGSATPTASSAGTIPGLVEVAAISCGWEHCCALRRDGTAACWGTYSEGPGPTAWSPADVPGLAEAEAIASGWDHDCAVVRGRMWCWGGNFEGELGDGTTTSSLTAVAVQGLP
jgi:alpha-tubulin suppressor-like RCC1 family protein